MSHRILVRCLPALLLVIPIDPAASQVFGQNKVQYKSLDWSVIETENFEVYFYEGEREAAIDAARMAERAYARLSAVFRHEIEEKVPLILYASHSDFQSSNVTPEFVSEGTGGFTEFLKRRVALPFTGGYADLDHVLTHELVHAFQVDILFGRGNRGLANPLGTYSPPLWFMEGMAEYLSVTRVDEATEMWLRDAALQGYLIPVSQLGRVYDIRVYRFGQSIFASIGAKFGDGRIGDLMKRVARTRSVDRAFKEVLGITLEKFSDDWMMDVRRAYLPEIRDRDRPEDFARRLSDGERDLASFHLAPALSSDGTQMAYLSDRSLYIDLYLASALDGKVQTRLVKGSRKEEFESLRFLSASLDFSPNGERVVLVSKVGGSDAIYLIETKDGRVRARLTFDLDGISHPSFSPDGNWIVFVGLDGGRSDLFRCRSDGAGFERLTDDRYLAASPRFAPDGQSIVFVTDEHPDTDFPNLIFAPPQIAILDLSNGETRLLERMAGANSSPSFFPDGRHLLYVSDRSGVANLHIRDLETGRDAQITNIMTGVTGVIPHAPSASLARNGKRLVFSAFSRGGWDLFAIENPLEAAAFEDPSEAPPAIVDAGPASEGAPLLGASEPAVSQPPARGSPGERDGAAATPDLRVRTEGDSIGDEPEPPRPIRIGEIFQLHRDLPDTSGFVFDPYRVRFSVDYAAASGFFASNVGLAAQTVLRFSDVLGNHTILIGASVYGSVSDSDLLFQYVNLSRRINYGIALFQLRDDFFLTTAEDRDEFVSQIYRGGELSLSRPFSRFRRLDLTLEGLQVDETVYQEAFSGSNLFIRDPVEENNLYFVRPGIALVGDNTLYGLTGPISGTRSRYGVDISLGDLQSSRWIADRRSYLNIRQRHAFAMRMVAATSQGRDPQIYRIGGPWTVRGYPYGEFDGNHIGLLNLEFRFPLIETLQFGWPLPLGLRGVRGAIFFDAGAAWYEHERFRAFRRENGPRRLDDIHASYGLSATMNIGFTVLRWDLAQPTNLEKSVGKLRGSFSIGSDF